MSSLAAIQFVPGRLPTGRHGQIADTGVREERGDLEIAGRSVQVQTVTISGSVSGAAYSIEAVELNTIVSFVGGASDTASATALAAAWNADPIARGFAVATSALGVVTLTGTGIGGADWSLTLIPSSAVMTVAEPTAAADPSDFPVGVAVYLDSNGRATRTPPTAGSFVLTPAAVNSAVYYFSFIASNGPEPPAFFYITYTAGGSATAQEIVEGLKADFDRKVPSSIATASENNTAITVTGVSHAITLLAQDANSTPSAQVVGAGVLDKLIGFSYLDYQNEVNASGLSVHKGNRRVVFLRSGALVSNLAGASSKWLDQAYLGVDSGNAAEYGQILDAPGSGRIPLPKSAVVWGARPSVFEIRLGR